MSNGLCDECPSTAQQAMLMLVQFAFVTVFVIGLVLCGNDSLNNIQFLLLAFKYVQICVRLSIDHSQDCLGRIRRPEPSFTILGSVILLCDVAVRR